MPNVVGGGMTSWGGAGAGGKILMSDGGVYVTVAPPVEPVALAVRIASPRTSIVTWFGVFLKSVIGATVSWVSLTRANVPSPLGTRRVNDRAVPTKRSGGWFPVVERTGFERGSPRAGMPGPAWPPVLSNST